VQWEVGLGAGTPGSTAAIDEVPGMRALVARVAHDAGADKSGLAGEAPALYDVSHISDGDVGKIVPIDHRGHRPRWAAGTGGRHG
jgi:hypothetical protein